MSETTKKYPAYAGVYHLIHVLDENRVSIADDAEGQWNWKHMEGDIAHVHVHLDERAVPVELHDTTAEECGLEGRSGRIVMMDFKEPVIVAHILENAVNVFPEAEEGYTPPALHDLDIRPISGP